MKKSICHAAPTFKWWNEALPKLCHIECGCGITQYSANCGVLRWLSGAEVSVAEVSRESSVFFYNIFQIRRNVKEVFGSGLKAISKKKSQRSNAFEWRIEASRPTAPHEIRMLKIWASYQKSRITDGIRARR